LASGALRAEDNDFVRKTGIPQYKVMKEEFLND